MSHNGEVLPYYQKINHLFSQDTHVLKSHDVNLDDEYVLSKPLEILPITIKISKQPSPSSVFPNLSELQDSVG